MEGGGINKSGGAFAPPAPPSYAYGVQACAKMRIIDHESPVFGDFHYVCIVHIPRSCLHGKCIHVASSGLDTPPYYREPMQN